MAAAAHVLGIVVDRICRDAGSFSPDMAMGVDQFNIGFDRPFFGAYFSPPTTPGVFKDAVAPSRLPNRSVRQGPLSRACTLSADSRSAVAAVEPRLRVCDGDPTSAPDRDR